MRLTELPADWKPEAPLEIVAHIRRALSALGTNGGFTVHADSDEFSTFHAAHLMVNDVPVVLMEHDPTPNYVYVYMPQQANQRERTLEDLLDSVNVGSGDVAWSLWRE